jgi:hypothetical protein
MPKTNDPETLTIMLLKRLADPHPMRGGWVGERWMKCGKASCPCQNDPAARHGPYYTLTTPTKGKTRTRYLSVKTASVVQEQIQAAKEFRLLVKEVLKTAEQWADAKLEETQAASEDAAKKGASKSSLRRRSSRKSKGSSVRGR